MIEPLDDARALADAIAIIEANFVMTFGTNRIDALKRILSRPTPVPQCEAEPVATLRLCGYCMTWNSKPCGNQCHWQPTDQPFRATPPSRSDAESVDEDNIRLFVEQIAFNPEFRCHHARYVKLLGIIDGTRALVPPPSEAGREALEDARHVRSALETLSDPLLIKFDGHLVGTARAIAIIERMRDIAATALLHLPDAALSDPGTVAVASKGKST